MHLFYLPFESDPKTILVLVPLRFSQMHMLQYLDLFLNRSCIPIPIYLIYNILNLSVRLITWYEHDCNKIKSNYYQSSNITAIMGLKHDITFSNFVFYYTPNSIRTSNYLCSALLFFTTINKQ